MKNIIEKLNISTFENIFTQYANQSYPAQLAAGLVSRGKLAHVFSIGFDSSATKNPASQTQFRIASMTKCFASAMLLKLRDQGKVALTDPIHKFIPGLKDERWARVTLLDLLTMRSGLPTDDPWGDRLLPFSNEELTKVYGQNFIYACEPGSEFHYSNLGYMILGRVISEVSGRSALEAIREHILIPLEMNDTEWIPSGNNWLPGYTKYEDSLVKQPIDHAIGDGAVFAGLWSTVSDLALWLTFLMNSDQSKSGHYQDILSVSSRQELQRGIVTVPPPKSIDALTESFDYALGLRSFSNRELIFAGHSGGLPGYGSHFRWHLDSHIGVIALANLTYADVFKPCQEALRIAVLNQRASDKPVPSLVQERAQQLFSYFTQTELNQDSNLFASNFFKDNPWESFPKDFADLSKKFSNTEWSKLLILPEPGLGARLLVEGEIACSFSLSPGEGGKIQEVIKTPQ